MKPEIDPERVYPYTKPFPKDKPEHFDIILYDNGWRLKIKDGTPFQIVKQLRSKHEVV